MAGAPAPTRMEDLEGFVRIPGVFRRSEIEQVLRSGCDFHIQPERLLPGTQLFAVYQQEPNDAASWPTCGPRLSDRGGQGPTVTTTASSLHGPLPTSPRARPEPNHESQAPDQPSLGELKARRREEHLCLACTHHLVCGMANALDETLLVTISRCRGFEPAEDGAATTCELIPIEPAAAL